MPHACSARSRSRGRTRWALYDRGLDRFFVNIAEPAQIIVVAGDAPNRIADNYQVGLPPDRMGFELDTDSGRLCPRV